MTRFIVLSEPRSGSTFFQSLIASHPRIQMFGEIFSADVAISQLLRELPVAEKLGFAACVNLRRRDPEAFLRDIIFADHKGSQTAIGFRIFYGHPVEREAYEKTWGALRQDKGLKILHLKRRNLLRRYLSLEQAMTSNTWAALDPDSPQPPALRIDPIAFTKSARDSEKNRESFAQQFAGHPYLEVIYEDLVANQSKIMDEVFRFLQAPSVRAEARTFRQNRLPLYCCIRNFDELREQFKDSRYESFFDDPGDTPLTIKQARSRFVIMNGATALRNARTRGVRLFCHLGTSDQDILPHFLAYYRALGVFRFHFILHGNWEDADERVLFGGANDIEIVERYGGPFDDLNKKSKLTDAVLRYIGEWVLVVDADEFLELPYRDLNTTIRALTTFGHSSLFAQMLQRISSDGGFPTPDPGQKLEAVFPLCSRFLCERMGAGKIWTSKYPLLLVHPNSRIERGNHLSPDGYIGAPDKLAAIVHHFKWRAGLLDTLKKWSLENDGRHEMAYYRDWLSKSGCKLPLEGAFAYSRETLFREGMLRRPDRAQLKSMIQNARIARVRSNATSVKSNGQDNRLLSHLQNLEERWGFGSQTAGRIPAHALDLLAKNGRIAIVTFQLPPMDSTGGIGTASAAMAEALAAQGHDVTILYCPLARREVHDLAIDFWRSRGVVLEGLGLATSSSGEGFSSLPEFSYKVASWLAGRSFDVVHFHDNLGLGMAACSAKRQGVLFADTVLVVTAHGPTGWHKRGNGEPVSLREQLISYGETEQIHWADYVQAPTRYMLDFVEKSLDLSGDQSRKNKRPTTHFVHPNVMSKEMRGLQVVDRSVRRIDELVFFGRVEPRKGHDIFIAAIERLIAAGRRGFKATFLGAFGNERIGREVTGRVRDWPIEVGIHNDFGPLQARHYLLEHAALAVIPSRSDNAPYTVIECLENGVPFVASSIGGVPELIDSDDRARVLVEPTLEAFAAALSNALDAGAVPARLSFDLDEAELKWLAWHGRLLKDVRADNLHMPRPNRAQAKAALFHYGDFSLPSAEISKTVLERELIKGHSLFSTQQAAVNSDSNATSDRSQGTILNTLAGKVPHEFLLFCHTAIEPTDRSLPLMIESLTISGADAAVCSYELLVQHRRNLDCMVHPLAGPAGLTPFQNLFGAPFFLIRRNVFERLGGFSTDPEIEGYEHWELLNRLLQKGGDIVCVPQRLLRYRTTLAVSPLAVPPPKVRQRLLEPLIKGRREDIRTAFEILGSDAKLYLAQWGYIRHRLERNAGTAPEIGADTNWQDVPAGESGDPYRMIEAMDHRLRDVSLKYERLANSRNALIKRLFQVIALRMRGERP